MVLSLWNKSNTPPHHIISPRQGRDCLENLRGRGAIGNRRAFFIPILYHWANVFQIYRLKTLATSCVMMYSPPPSPHPHKNQVPGDGLVNTTQDLQNIDRLIADQIHTQIDRERDR